MSTALVLSITCGALAVLYGLLTTRQILSADPGTERMREISAAVQEGATAYLNRQYRAIAIVGLVVGAILWALLGAEVGIGFLIGAVLSGATGYIGMNVSVRANSRTAHAATVGVS